MGKNSSVSGVFLDYVAREVEDDITVMKTKFNPKKGENEQKEEILKDPIIVFFPNGTSQVMSTERAEANGFLVRPEVIGIDSVKDTESFAGKYKNAFNPEERMTAWKGLESEIINKCISTTGHPLDLGTMYSDKSIYLNEKENVNVTEL